MASARVWMTTPYWASRSLLPRRTEPFCRRARLTASARESACEDQGGMLLGWTFSAASASNETRTAERKQAAARIAGQDGRRLIMGWFGRFIELKFPGGRLVLMLFATALAY